jgi:hypothetical protein
MPSTARKARRGKREGGEENMWRTQENKVGKSVLKLENC